MRRPQILRPGRSAGVRPSLLCRGRDRFGPWPVVGSSSPCRAPRFPYRPSAGVRRAHVPSAESIACDLLQLRKAVDARGRLSSAARKLGLGDEAVAVVTPSGSVCQLVEKRCRHHRLLKSAARERQRTAAFAGRIESHSVHRRPPFHQQVELASLDWCHRQKSVLNGVRTIRRRSDASAAAYGK